MVGKPCAEPPSGGGPEPPSGEGDRSPGWSISILRQATACLETGRSATGFLLRALRWFREQGIRVQRLLTDNGSCFKSKLLNRACRRLAIKHIFTRPYRPQTNGKAERWIRTALSECLYLEVFHSPETRAAALRRFVLYYNELRPHPAVRGSPPRHRLLQAAA